jgi:kynurenine formamidase
MKRSVVRRATLVAAALLSAGMPLLAAAVEPPAMRAKAARAPTPPWPAGDERGMANVLGPASTERCGWHMTRRGARTYEASYERSNTMPKSPFAPPSLSKPKPTAGVPFSAHAFNSESFEAGAEPQQQGTQIDALGHFASIKDPWDPKNTFTPDGASYYGGFKQQDVKPTPDSPLLKLGIDKIPPLVTTAVLLDARAFLGKGKAMGPGQLVTAAAIDAMIQAQGLGRRGLLPGDMVWIYTGWSEHWKDPADPNGPYYAMAPGLSVDAAKMLAARRVVAVGVDAPFIDAVPEGMLQGKAPPAPGTDPGLPFSIHHYLLSVYGIHQLENLNLAAMAADKVWTSCAMVLPSRDKGAAGAVIRPVAIGVPGQK